MTYHPVNKLWPSLEHGIEIRFTEIYNLDLEKKDRIKEMSYIPSARDLGYLLLFFGAIYLFFFFSTETEMSENHSLLKNSSWSLY